MAGDVFQRKLAMHHFLAMYPSETSGSWASKPYVLIDNLKNRTLILSNFEKETKNGKKDQYSYC